LFVAYAELCWLFLHLLLPRGAMFCCCSCCCSSGCCCSCCCSCSCWFISCIQSYALCEVCSRWLISQAVAVAVSSSLLLQSSASPIETSLPLGKPRSLLFTCCLLPMRSSRGLSLRPRRVLSFVNRLPLRSRHPFSSVRLVRCCSHACLLPARLSRRSSPRP
jgi:hypothetical protein